MISLFRSLSLSSCACSLQVQEQLAEMHRRYKEQNPVETAPDPDKVHWEEPFSAEEYTTTRQLSVGEEDSLVNDDESISMELPTMPTMGGGNARDEVVVKV